MVFSPDFRTLALVISTLIDCHFYEKVTLIKHARRRLPANVRV